jgi:hypothetical protein
MKITGNFTNGIRLDMIIVSRLYQDYQVFPMVNILRTLGPKFIDTLSYVCTIEIGCPFDGCVQY